jgi:hypothetical protein
MKADFNVAMSREGFFVDIDRASGRVFCRMSGVSSPMAVLHGQPQELPLGPSLPQV